LKKRFEEFGLFPSDILPMSEGEMLFNYAILGDEFEAWEADKFLSEIAGELTDKPAVIIKDLDKEQNGS